MNRKKVGGGAGGLVGTSIALFQAMATGFGLSRAMGGRGRGGLFSRLLNGDAAIVYNFYRGGGGVGEERNNTI